VNPSAGHLPATLEPLGCCPAADILAAAQRRTRIAEGAPVAVEVVAGESPLDSSRRGAGRWDQPRKEGNMNINLHAPSMPMFVVSLVLAVLALLGYFVTIPYITLYGFLLAIIAYAVLALGNVVKT
jgi:hypothetical protein